MIFNKLKPIYTTFEPKTLYYQKLHKNQKMNKRLKMNLK